MKKLIIALVLSFSLISSNFLYATEINNSLVPTENIDNTNEVEVPVSAGNTTTTGSTNVLNNYSDTNVPYETNPVTNSLESVIPDEDLYDINEENFPDIALRTFLKSYDIPAEGESEGNKKLSREEIKKIDYISLFYDTNDATDVNLKGLELLPYINNLYISNRTSEKKIVHNIDSLNNLENLNTLNLSGVNVDDSI